MTEQLKEEGVSFRQTCPKCQKGLLFAEKKHVEDNRVVLLEQCTKCNYSKEIAKALMIEPCWLSMILNGVKTWEMRIRPCRIRGSIGLIQISSGEIKGAVDIVGTRGPMDYEELAANIGKHQSTPDALIDKNRVHAWILENPRKYIKPIPYKHPRGAQIWVTLSKEVLDD